MDHVRRCLQVKKLKLPFLKKNLFLIFGAYPSFGDHRSLRQKGRPTPNWLRYTIKIFAWKAEVEGDTPHGGGRTTIPRYRLTVPTICSNSHAPHGGALLFQVIGLRYLIYRYTVNSMCSNSHAPHGGALLFQVIGLRYLIYRYPVNSMCSNSHALPPTGGEGGGHYYSKLLAYGT